MRFSVEFWLGDRDSNSQRDTGIWIFGKVLVILDWERILRLSYGLAGLFRSLWIALGIDTKQTPTCISQVPQSLLSLWFKQPDSLAEAAAIWTTQSFNFE